MRIRVLSDIHFGDPATKVHRMAQLRPLLEEVDEIILNGDTLDTRPGPNPTHTTACREHVHAFISAQRKRITLLTGNHDPDISAHHALDLAGGRVLAMHGDILFDDIVPWGRDAQLISRLIAAEFHRLPAEQHHHLETRFAIWRRVAGQIPQRHQAEPRGLKYLAGFIADTVWPPLRVFRVLGAWRTEPHRAAAFVRRHRPDARFVLLGHTHRPAIRRAGDLIIINTGTYCPPFGAYAIDLTPNRLSVLRVVERRGEFHPGGIVAEFPLAAG